MKKYILIGLILVLSISIVSASIIGTFNNNKIIDVKSDSIAWNNGFRSSNDLETCKVYSPIMDSSTIMKCYGFKEVN